jgi:hypothetical protein
MRWCATCMRHADGVVFQKVEAHVSKGKAKQSPEFFDGPYYMILNTAVGGHWPGEPTAQTKFPLHHTIDYVRIAQPTTSSEQLYSAAPTRAASGARSSKPARPLKPRNVTVYGLSRHGRYCRSEFQTPSLYFVPRITDEIY